MTDFSSRPVACYDLPLSDELTILRAEQVIIRFPNRKTIDIGAICYLVREEVPTHKKSIRRATEGRKVMLSSLCPVRVNHIRRFITHVSEKLLIEKKSEFTLYGSAGKFVLFMNWADENGHSDALDDEGKTRAAVKAYAAYIRERVMAHEISQNTGARLQKDTFALLSEFLDIDALTRGLPLLRRDASSTEATIPPSEVSQTRVLRLCEALFSGLTALVLEKKPYPFGIIMPSYLGYPNDVMWVFPVRVWCQPVARLNTKKNPSAGQVFDYFTGRLRTRAEVETLNKKDDGSPRTDISSRKIRRALANAKRLISNANLSPNHNHRKSMGMIAVNAFVRLFLSRTGMNWEQLVSLRWTGDDNEAVSAIRQKFREIKHRAGNKMVSYQLPLKFMPFFKKYLQLRAYLLQGYPEFDGLFFTLGLGHVEAPDYLKTSLEVTYRALSRIDPLLNPVLSRGWRAAKSDWLLTRVDVSTAAQILQNSEPTVRKSYAAGTVEKHLSEMTDFFDRMVLDKELMLGGNRIAVGKCSSYNEPQELLGVDAAVKPNCENPEIGCLFCDKFKIHADETDVRKLLSCRYCLTRTSHLAGFYVKSEPLIKRIDSIIDEVNKRDTSLVSRIMAEVSEGELDPYWISKYDMLLRLRLVNDTN